MPLNILLADDSVPAQNMGKKILVDAGYQVLTVSNGLEALRKINDTRPDIAILDIFMPGYSGLEICEKLRANAATADLPVVLTVGKLEPYRPEDGEHVHSNAVIVKPFSATELVGAVRSLIGSPQVEAAEPEFAASDVLPSIEEEDPFAFATGTAPVFEGTPATHAQPFSLTETATAVEEFAGPESLAFNPDAKPSRFSASVAEMIPASPATSGRVASVFDEFDLHRDAPAVAAVAEVASPAAVEVADEPIFEIAGVETTAPAVHQQEPEVILVDPLEPEEHVAEAHVEVAPVSEQAEDAYAAIDPLLDLGEKKDEPGILADVALQVGEIPEPVVEHAEPIVEEEHLSEEDKARRQAFEELFNSTEVFAVDELPSAALEPSLESLVGTVEPPPEAVPSAVEEMAVTEASFELDPRLEDFTSQMTDIAPVEATEPAPDVFEGAVVEPAVIAPPAVLEPIAYEAQAELEPAIEEQAHAIQEIVIEPEVPVATEAAAIEQPLVAPLESFESFDLPESAMEFAPEPVLESVEVLEPILENSPVLESAVDAPFEVAAEADVFAEQGADDFPRNFVHAADVAEPAPYTLDVEIPATEQELDLGEAVVAEAFISKPVGSPIEPEAAEGEAAPTLQELESLELAQTQPESYETEILTMEAAGADFVSAEIQPVQAQPAGNESERIHQAVERVFEKFKPLLVAAIVRELARHE